jgi:cell division control protein 45
MYLSRDLISLLYTSLLRSHHPLSPPVLILVSLDPDSLCACRILTTLLKRDYIPHKIQPVAGYADLLRAGNDVVKPMRTSEGGVGGVVVCVGVGGMVDLSSVLGLEADYEGEGGMGGVEVWVFDARRPWNLGNVFGGRATQAHLQSEGSQKEVGVKDGKIERNYKPGLGGIIVFDDGDIEEELQKEREAYCALEQMPDVDEEEDDADEDTESEDEHQPQSNRRKRKSWGDDDEDTDSDDGDRPRQRRRSNSVRLADTNGIQSTANV